MSRVNTSVMCVQAVGTNEDTNPWAAETWNMTAQSLYVRKYGMARAHARARDAGTTVGGPRPRLLAPTDPRKLAEVAVVRPGNPPIYRFMVPARRDEVDGNLRVDSDGNYRGTSDDDFREWKD